MHLLGRLLYDDLGRVRDVLAPPGTQRFGYDAASYSLDSLQYLQGGSATQHLQYAYDGSYQITEIEDLVAGVTAAYGYDQRGRLGSFERDGDSRFFAYDSIGNLILRDGAEPNASPNQLYDHADKPHAVTQGANGLSYAYDADGNAIQRGAKHLSYDAQNRLVCTGSAPGSCSDAKFGYTLDGTRYWDTKAGTTPGIVFGDWFQWDTPTQTATTHIYAFGREIAYRVSHNASLRSAEILPAWWLPVGPKPLGWALAVLAGSGALLLAVRAGVPGHVAERPAAAALSLALSITLLPNPAWAGAPPIFGNGGNAWVPRWIVADHLGTGELILDASGGIVQERSFDPFGKLTAQSWPTEASLRLFTGQRFQNGAGLYDFKARWYDADVGRFLSVDPILQNLGDPQTHNAYGYVRNDPVNLTDPTGLCVEGFSCLGFIIWAVIQGVSTAAAAGAFESGASAPISGTIQDPTLAQQAVPEALSAAASGVARLANAAAEPAPGRSEAASTADTPGSQSDPLSDPINKAGIEAARKIEQAIKNSGQLGDEIDEWSVSGTPGKLGEPKKDPQGNPNRAPGPDREAGDTISAHVHPPRSYPYDPPEDFSKIPLDRSTMSRSPGVHFFLITEKGALIRRDVIQRGNAILIGPRQEILPPGSFRFP